MDSTPFIIVLQNKTLGGGTLLSRIEEQLKRAEKMKEKSQWGDYSKLKPIVVGICWNDGE